MTCQIGWATTSSAFSVGMGAIPPPLTEAILAGATPPQHLPTLETRLGIGMSVPC